MWPKINSEEMHIRLEQPPKNIRTLLMVDTFAKKTKVHNNFK